MKPTLLHKIKSFLSSKASKDLEKEIEEELKLIDPSKEKAEATLKKHREVKE